MQYLYNKDAAGYFSGVSVWPQDPVAGGLAQINPVFARAEEPPAHDPETHRVRDSGSGWVLELVSVPEPAPAPEEQPDLPPSGCTRRQGRLALLVHGHLDVVEAHITAIADPIERRAAQIEYEADTWERSNPFVQQMWAQLGGSPAQLDELYRLAITL